ncbi:hypothetical protein H4R34_005618 [Dimargaris verticillata]|uniref:Uncharacterized protein n=1 Tax=Dimargaris verticillata TaxID=2761393 RepID=A0A9W8AXV1_9FUNG|nr:hypothetical protein H4R34_005618 [Dimargaris verticillata]
MAPRARSQKSRRRSLSESDDNSGPVDASSDNNALESPRSTRSSRRAAATKTPRYSLQEDDSSDDFEDLRPRAKASKVKASAKADASVSAAGSVTSGSTPPSRKRKEPDSNSVDAHSPRPAAKPKGGAQTLTSPAAKTLKPTGLTRPPARSRLGTAGGKQASTTELLNKMSPRPVAAVRTGLAKSTAGGVKSNGARPVLGTTIPAVASPVRVGLTRHRTAKPKLHAYLYK